MRFAFHFVENRRIVGLCRVNASRWIDENIFLYRCLPSSCSKTTSYDFHPAWHVLTGMSRFRWLFIDRNVVKHPPRTRYYTSSRPKCSQSALPLAAAACLHDLLKDSSTIISLLLKTPLVICTALFVWTGEERRSHRPSKEEC